MTILKSIEAEEGRRLIEQVRLQALDREWFSTATSGYPPGALPLEGRELLSIEEHQGNITDLLVYYRFRDGFVLVGKFFLPVVKTRPWLGFEGLDDRGRSIDRRMRWMQRAVLQHGISLPHPYHYDAANRVLWMEFIGGSPQPLASEMWSWALPRIAQSIAAVHRMEIPAASLPEIENSLFRRYLIEYPFLHLEPFLDGGAYRGRWREFVSLDEGCRRSLIHGDFKQENIVLAGGRLWFMDLERSNYANPAYDVGWILCHLLIEARDRKLDGEAALTTFLTTYARTCPFDEEFGFCVIHYLILFAAYRTAAHGVLKLHDAGTPAWLSRMVPQMIGLSDRGLWPFLSEICHLSLEG
jgi:tRNA A-37 threonylcarbamoyl transferase component Bud32